MTPNRHPRAALWCALFGLALPSSAPALDLFVDRNGVGGACSDSRTRAIASNPATPLCLIPTGISLALSGDRIVVRRGTHALTAGLVLGTAGISLAAFPGEAVVLDFTAAPVGTVGLTLNGSGTALEGLEISGAPADCVFVHGTGARVTRNHIHDCGKIPDGAGAYQNALESDAADALIERNRLHDSGYHAVKIAGSGFVVRNNLIYRTLSPDGVIGAYGMAIGNSSAVTDRARIVHNVIGESVNRSSIVFSSGQNIAEVTIANNVLYGNPGWPVFVYDVAGWTGPVRIEANLFAGNGADCVFFDTLDACGTPPAAFTVTGNLTPGNTASIGFANPAAGDFSPATGASPMVDTGLSGFAADDFLGRPRPAGSAPDLGAYEFGAVAPPPAPTPTSTPTPALTPANEELPPAPRSDIEISTSGCAARDGGMALALLLGAMLALSELGRRRIAR